MFKKAFFGFSLAGCLLAGVGGCNYENVSDLPIVTVCDPNAAVSFAADIVPIMTGSCSSNTTSCHAVGNFNNADLDTYLGVKDQVDNGKLISSIIWDDVATTSRMPSGSSTKIDDCAIGKIQRWIADGAPNN